MCGGEGAARVQARPSPVVGPGPMRHPAGWPDVDWTTPLRSCEMADERARITTLGERESIVASKPLFRVAQGHPARAAWV